MNLHTCWKYVLYFQHFYCSADSSQSVKSFKKSLYLFVRILFVSLPESPSLSGFRARVYKERCEKPFRGGLSRRLFVNYLEVTVNFPIFAARSDGRPVPVLLFN